MGCFCRILFLFFCFVSLPNFSRKVSPPSVIESTSQNNRKVGEGVGESTDFRLHHTHGGPQGDADRRRAPYCVFLNVWFFLGFSKKE